MFDFVCGTGAYTKFLMGEAQRAAHIFHQIAGDLGRSVGVEYRGAPNKQASRVLKKQSPRCIQRLNLTADLQ